MACNSTSGNCLPYSCNWGFYLNGTTCTQGSVDASTAIMASSSVMANCIGYNRTGDGSTANCVSSTNKCDSRCSDAGCIKDSSNVSYCFACKSAWPSTPATAANMLVNDGTNGYLWIKASQCTGNTVVASMSTTCSQFAGTNYCTLCKDGYIAKRTSTSASTCISRSTNTAYLDPAQLLYCIMVDASGNCLSCDILKNSAMTSNTACTAPTDPGIVGYHTWPETATSKWHYRQTGHSGYASNPDVFIGDKLGSAPSSAQDNTAGGKIFVKTTSDNNSLESFSLASDYPYLHGTAASNGVHYVYTFGYGYYVEESYIAYRTPSHVFGSYKTWSDSANWACPTNPTTGATCSGTNMVTGSTKCQSVSSAAPVQPNCECNSGFAGLACEETVTVFNKNFSKSQKATTVGQKMIYETTREDMVKYGFTDIRASVPDYTQKSGGQDIMAMTRGQWINGQFNKQTWNGDVWTANSYLPGFQQEYWTGTKLGKEFRRVRLLEGLGNNTRKLRLRILSRFFNAASYKMTVGLNKNAITSMAANTKIYFTMVRLFNRSITLSAETLERGMPLALKIIIPIFSIGAIGILVLVMWCMFDESGDDGEEDEGSVEKANNDAEHPEDNQNLIKNNSDSDKKSNKADNQVFPIGETKTKTMEKTMNDDTENIEQDRNPATQTIPLSNEPFIEKTDKNPSNNFIEENASDHVQNQESVKNKPESMGDDNIEMGLQQNDEANNFEDL